jgi:hypothetical protein
MKRTCEGCKALRMEQYYSECMLGYKLDDHFKPLEECPKPKTNMAYIDAKKYGLHKK